MNRMNRKLLFMILLTLGILLTGCTQETPETAAVTETTVLTEPTEAPTTEPTTLPTETEPQEERFLLTFVGDCTFGSNPTNYFAGYGFIKTVGEDYRYPFQNVIGYLENDEFTMLNLEGPLCDEGNPMQKKHAFHGPTAYINILTENSVEAVTIANNHTMDYGQTGYDSTVATLNGAEIPFVERDASTIVTTENGLTIGLYAAVYYLLDVEDMVAEITALKEQGCDLIIFAPHWGTEGTYRPTQQQTDVGHAAIDAGADIVYGSHPHVLQPIEEYNGGIIYYSLGNFSFGGNGYPQDYDTALLQQEVIRDPEGNVTLGALTIVPANVSSVAGRNNFQPTPYSEGTEEYARVLAKLDGTFSGPNLKIS
ncbi:MAG: CapA family protein [Oscillospiraceae bacterium]|nr:CapA family protein [Oscillospiraceae bacterium]